MKIIIEKARVWDKPDIYRLLKTANMHAIPSEEMPRLTFENYYIARVDDRFAGFCGYKILSPNSAKTELMVVDPVFRGKGVGYALQRFRMERMLEAGIHRLTTNADRPDTIAWYRKHFGYRPVGFLKKKCEFGETSIDRWTTLQTDLKVWSATGEAPREYEYRESVDLPHPIRPYPKLIINAAITGMVPQKTTTPYVPLSVEEIIADAVACQRAGASIIHLHARDENGVPTHRRDIYSQILSGIRAACPNLILCVSTSGRIHSDYETRAQVLELEGDCRPDAASLTLGSLNFINRVSVNSPEVVMRLAATMQERGIVPELEIFDAGMLQTAKLMIRNGILRPPYYFNILGGSIYSMPATLGDLAHLTDQLPPETVWAAAGIGRFQQIMNYAAVLSGGHVRVGLEDNIYYDAGRRQRAANPQLIERVVKFAGEIGREIAAPEEARMMIGMPFKENGKTIQI